MATLNEKIIYIFRHGETDWNREGRMQGGTDIPLNSKGREQAAKLTAFFAKNPVDIFLSSDLNRAFETAKIAAGDYLKTKQIIVDARLRETNLGDAEGLTGDEINARFGEGTLEAWRHSTADHLELNRNFRFPNGESKAEHLARNLEALEEFLEKTPHQLVAVASHGGAMRRLIHHIVPDLTSPIMVENCIVYRLYFMPGQKLWRMDLEPAHHSHD